LLLSARLNASLQRPPTANDPQFNHYLLKIVILSAAKNLLFARSPTTLGAVYSQFVSRGLRKAGTSHSENIQSPLDNDSSLLMRY